MDGIETYREGAHTVRVVTDRHKFSKFRRRWNTALAQYPHASIYMTHEWLQALWDIYEDDIDGQVMMVDDKEGPCAMAPFISVKYRYGGMSIPAVGPIPAARTDIPLIRDQIECMRLLGSYTKGWGAQLWHLHNVPEKSPVVQLLHTEWDVGRTVEEYDRESFPVIDTSTSWPQFLNTRDSMFHEEVAGVHAGVQDLELRPVTDAAALLAIMNRVKKRSDVQAAPVEDYRRTAFTERVIQDAAEAGTLRSMVAFDESLFAKPAVGFTVGIEYNGTLHILDTGGDQKYPSAGTGTFAEMLWGAFDQDHIKRFDVSELDESAVIERAWATDEDRHVSTLILNGGMGSVAVRAGRTLGGIKRAFALPKLGRKGEAAA